MRILALPLVLSFLLLSACSGHAYVTPGAPADFHALGISNATQAARTESRIQSALDKKPAANFPATLAIVRVQDRGYQTSTARGFGSGRFTVVTVRDVEKDETYRRLATMPQIRAVAPINRLIVPSYLNEEGDLRAVAAGVQADVLLLYTFDTVTESDVTIAGLGLLTLGLFPNEVQNTTSTVSAAFLDVRTGYIFGLCEGTGTARRHNNAWNTFEAMDAARKLAESNAFDALLPQIEETWAGIVKVYASRAPKQD